MTIASEKMDFNLALPGNATSRIFLAVMTPWVM